jgi:glycosyltransferase involved in cell wall biosynthesis
MKILDNMALGCVWLKSYLPEKRRWSFSLGNHQKQPKVYFGFDDVPSVDQHASGGIVKLQDLQKIFPNHCQKPNILYLISSALPHFSIRMASLANKAGVKLVLNQNGVAYPGWYGKGWEQCNRPMQKLHELANYIIYQSEFCKMSADHFLGRSTKRWKIVYNPVDTSVFKPAENTKERSTVKLLLAGSHGSFYRPQTAIDVLRFVSDVVPNVELVIAGGFHWLRDQQKARKQVLEYARQEAVEERVKLFGLYTQNQAIDLFRGVDLLLHTKYNDPCPRLVVEAMACGLPIVYSATGGVPELVGKYAGFGVPGPLDWDRDHPPSSEKLAEGVLEVIKNLDDYRTAARQQAVEHFDVQPWLAEHERIFSEILAEKL